MMAFRAPDRLVFILSHRSYTKEVFLKASFFFLSLRAFILQLIFLMRIANVRDVFMTYQVAESAKSTCTFHFRPFHIDDLERKLDGTLCRS